MKVLIAVISFTFAGCAHLPPTNLPVCAGHFNEVCRAPVRCDELIDKQNTYCGCKTTEKFRDEAWDRANACWPFDSGERANLASPNQKPVEGHPNLVACYEHRGVMDSRAVYEYIVRERRKR